MQKVIIELGDDEIIVALKRPEGAMKFSPPDYAAMTAIAILPNYRVIHGDQIRYLTCKHGNDFEKPCQECEKEEKFESKRVEVCSRCLTASCWYGDFICYDYETAGTELKTVAQLRELNVEDPGYWSDEKMSEIYGNPAPYGYE